MLIETYLANSRCQEQGSVDGHGMGMNRLSCRGSQLVHLHGQRRSNTKGCRWQAGKALNSPFLLRQCNSLSITRSRLTQGLRRRHNTNASRVVCAQVAANIICDSGGGRKGPGRPIDRIHYDCDEKGLVAIRSVGSEPEVLRQQRSSANHFKGGEEKLVKKKRKEGKEQMVDTNVPVHRTAGSKMRKASASLPRRAAQDHTTQLGALVAFICSSAYQG